MTREKAIVPLWIVLCALWFLAGIAWGYVIWGTK